MKIALVGATGLVGNVMMEVLNERGFGDCQFIPAASPKSVGKEIRFAGKTYTVQSVEDAIAQRPQIAIFSAGATASKQYAPLFAAKGTYVVDNSSAWRMNPNIPLVVPEINAYELNPNKHIIANPNCSTIQMVLALAPLHKAFGIKRIVVSTYQSVTGTGVKAVQQLNDERNGNNPDPVYPHPIDLNVIPHGGTFEVNGYTTEETKLLNETRKILGDPNIKVTATVVRVPVFGGHSEAVNVEFLRPFDIKEIYALLENMDGIKVVDDPANNAYPMPRMAHHKDEVFVGRIRRDDTVENGINLWVVADNLRKGAATNAVQIAQKLIERFNLQ